MTRSRIFKSFRECHDLIYLRASECVTISFFQLPMRRGGTRTARLKRQRAQRGHSHANGGHHFTRASVKRAASKVWKRLTRMSKTKTHEDQRNSVSKIDRASRVLFPLAFFLFNVFYGLLYYSL